MRRAARASGRAVAYTCRHAPAQPMPLLRRFPHRLAPRAAAERAARIPGAGAARRRTYLPLRRALRGRMDRGYGSRVDWLLGHGGNAIGAAGGGAARDGVVGCRL